MLLAFDAPRAGTAAPSARFGSIPVAIPAVAWIDAATHLARLERAITVALAPLDHPNAASWGNALGAALLELTGASAGAILLPGPTARWRTIAPLATDSPSVDHDEAMERLGLPGTGTPPEAQRGDVILWARDDLAGREPLRMPRPATRPRSAIGIRVRTSDGDVAAIYVRSDQPIALLERQVTASFRAIAPAFQAGVDSWRSVAAACASVEGMLASLTDAALLFDTAGTPAYANPALERLGGPTATRLREEAQRLAWALGAVARRRGAKSSTPDGDAGSTERRGSRSVRIGALVYQLRGSIVGEHLLGARPAVLVTVTAAATEPLTDDALRTEYGLTAREIQVARLVAQGLSNNEIAERLGVKFFTARNHVERTLAKLGVASRHRVGPLLRGRSAGGSWLGQGSLSERLAVRRSRLATR